MAEQDIKEQKKRDLGICAVTGSNGWFAAAVVSHLTQKGYSVNCLDITRPTIINKEINPYCPIENKLTKFYACDITNCDQVVAALKDVSTVFHVCAITDIRVCPMDKMEHVNVNGTATLLRACRACKVKQFVYTSSIEAINDGRIKDQANEKLKLVHNYNAYGTTKALAEQLVLKQSVPNMAVSILRLSHIFGADDPVMFATVNIPATIGDCVCKHSFIYIENCAYAHVQMAKALASKSKREQCNKQIFNVKDHDHNFIKFYRHVLCEKDGIKTLYIPYTVALILAYIYEFLVRILFKLFGIRFGDPIESFGVLAVEASCQEHTYNVDKFNSFVGYDAPVNLQEAIRRTRDWRKRKHSEKD